MFIYSHSLLRSTPYLVRSTPYLFCAIEAILIFSSPPLVSARRRRSPFPRGWVACWRGTLRFSLENLVATRVVGELLVALGNMAVLDARSMGSGLQPAD